MTPPPKLPPPGPRDLKFHEVPAYVQRHYGRTFKRRTVYNWATLGRRLDSLEWKNVPNPETWHKDKFIKVTQTNWVDEFMERLGIPRVH